MTNGEIVGERARERARARERESTSPVLHLAQPPYNSAGWLAPWGTHLLPGRPVLYFTSCRSWSKLLSIVLYIYHSLSGKDCHVPTVIDTLYLPQRVPHGQTESGGIELAGMCWSPEAVLPDRALYLPTFSHFLIAFSLCLSLPPHPPIFFCTWLRLRALSPHAGLRMRSKPLTIKGVVTGMMM